MPCHPQEQEQLKGFFQGLTPFAALAPGALSGLSLSVHFPTREWAGSEKAEGEYSQLPCRHLTLETSLRGSTPRNEMERDVYGLGKQPMV